MPAAIAERYVRLVRGVDGLLPGFVDSYTGPEEWVASGAPEAARLDDEATALLADLDGLDDAERAAFLRRQLHAVRTALRMVEAEARGERIAFAAEVEGLYGVVPMPVPEAAFASARSELDGYLPGAGTPAERLEALRGRLVVPGQRVLPVLGWLGDLLRERTRALVPLPDGESFAWEPVRGQPWAAYNWYLGDRRSRNEINLDLPWHLHDLPDIVAHEGYPGHHTERIIKAVRLVESGERPECAAQVLLAPEALLSEAIAVCALEQVVEEDELGSLIGGPLAGLAGLTLDEETVAAAVAARRFAQVVGDVVANASRLRHAGGAADDDVVAYLMEHGLVALPRARKLLAFMDAPLSRAYVFTYSEGRRRLGAALAQAPAGEERRDVFRRALARTDALVAPPVAM